MKLQKYENPHSRMKLTPFGYSCGVCRRHSIYADLIAMVVTITAIIVFRRTMKLLLLRDAEANARIRVAECRNAGIALAPRTEQMYTDIADRNGRKSETYKKDRIFCPPETRNSKSFLVFNKNVTKTRIIKR